MFLTDAYSSNNSNNTKNGQNWSSNWVWHLFWALHFFFLGFPRWLSGKESACQYRRHRFNSWARKIHWRRKWQPTPAFLPGECHGQRSLVDYTVRGVTESDTTAHTAQTNPCCFLKIFIVFHSFIWLCQVLVAACKLSAVACEIWVPDQRSHSHPLRWKVKS